MTQERFRDNVQGRFWVSTLCIDCALCPEIAPEHFTSNLLEGHGYVFRQPRDEREEALCREAMALCPAEAIRDDGPQG
jgi:ferredoxin